MTRPSPPLIFLGALCALWIGARVVVETWRQAEPTPNEARIAQPNEADVVTAKDGTMPSSPVRSANIGVVRAVKLATPSLDGRVRRRLWRIVPQDENRTVAVALTPPMQSVVQVPIRDDPPAALSSFSPALSAQPAPPRVDRWTLSGWVFVRPMSARTTLGQGLLGGSQAGVRASWRLDRDGRVELYARVVSSGRLGDGVEGAVGASAQPLRALPVRLSVERREQLAGSGGQSAFAAFASGGVSDAALPLHFRLDGYAAAGVVGVRRRDLFAEGSATVRRRIVEVGPVEVDAGMGAWAAVQPDLERIDVGPSVSARWRVGELRPRLSVDWRHRVLGDAAPDTGVAITLAADF